MTLIDLRIKLSLTTFALHHASQRVKTNPENKEAKAIKATLLLRQAVLSHEIKKQEGLAAICTK